MTIAKAPVGTQTRLAPRSVLPENRAATENQQEVSIWPMLQSRRVERVIKYKTARAPGRMIPRLLLQVDEMIE